MKKTIESIRHWIIFFMIVLILSGLTAIPLETELDFLSRCFPQGSLVDSWIEGVYAGIADMNRSYPFLAYGYDWLAFAHFVIALLFIGPLRDPVRSKWVIEFGMIACLLIIPFALVAGHFRGIPLWWRFIDCSFGLVGLVPLLICHGKILTVEKSILEQQRNEEYYNPEGFGLYRKKHAV